jgi:hypothetical protein
LWSEADDRADNTLQQVPNRPNASAFGNYQDRCIKAADATGQTCLLVRDILSHIAAAGGVPDGLVM